ncbi:chromosome partitioning protein [Amycolatopsis circi]|uniref:chromosome partitioning protein n=1 Tax=Amycolatopsis circi TaxID=871959 RepID=UPI000E270CB7|nr:chromosome partitioning protein [Amycolatopsis circi]
MGFEVVLGALIAWAVGKARRAGKTLDGVADEVVDAAAAKARAKVLELVLGKVGTDSAVAKLDEEVTASGQVSKLTRTRVELAVTAAGQDDPDFAAALTAAVAEVERHGGVVAAHGGTVITGTAATSGSGDAFGAVGSVTKVAMPDPQRPGRD